jgi:FMN phosphatase YigB (HAD superfamily)
MTRPWPGFAARSRKFQQESKSVSGRLQLSCSDVCGTLQLPAAKGTFESRCSSSNAWGERSWKSPMTLRHPMVFLVDVDNTLIDNDAIQQDLKEHLEQVYGYASRVRYWKILEDLFDELGYRDYIGALQRYRLEHPLEIELLAMSSFLVDYPFANRLFPGAIAVLQRLGSFGPVVILSDGDVVFQPRKVERAGLSTAVDGRVLIYVHKEEALNDVERRYPADHYVLVDDKVRILTTVKQIWGSRVTTVFVQQGSYANDRKAVASFPEADTTIEHIADLLRCDLPRLGMAPRQADPTLQAIR